jgi:hypothetical protein
LKSLFVVVETFAKVSCAKRTKLGNLFDGQGRERGVATAVQTEKTANCCLMPGALRQVLTPTVDAVP